jgi:ATP-dependent DNA ligase
MSIERMRERLAADRESFIEPCLPSPADKPPSGSNWIHEIKHDGYRLMARRVPERTALFRRSGCDGSCGSVAPIVAMNVSLIAASIHNCA